MAGFRNHTYCIHGDNLDLIEQAVTQIFEQEDCCRTPLPPRALPAIEKLRHEPWGCIDDLSHFRDLWVVGLFVGACGWTVVKTSPAELLCYRAKGATRPRLSQLAMQVDTEAFYLGVHETMREKQLEAILLEVNAIGQTFISGIVDPNHSEEGKFADEQINEPINFLEFGRFLLLDMPKNSIGRIEKELEEQDNTKYQQWEEQFKEDYARRNFRLWTPSELKQWKAQFQENPFQLFDADGGEQLFEDWAAEIRFYNFLNSRSTPERFDEALKRIVGGSQSYWNLEDLAYKVYTSQQQLAADGVRLLYFQPPTPPYINLPLDSLSENEGDDWLLDDEGEDERDNQGDNWSFWVDEDE